jgi:glycosyltransferase involved in cell wall biosynthesis
METKSTNFQCADSTIATLIGEISQYEVKYHDYEYPRVSIVIPIYNCQQDVIPTLKSILTQVYPDFEVVIVDGGSTDRTLEVIKALRDDRIHIYSVSSRQRYEMINKGISQSTGAYINILVPGDFYLCSDTLKHMMSIALDHDKPHLVFCGTLLRDGRSEVKILYRHLSLKQLRRGQQPTSLQSVWFRADTFREIGKFNASLSLRGGYDLLCRFALHKNLRAASTNRILTDYNLRWVTKREVITHFFETFHIVLKYFGIATLIHWLFVQKDAMRFLKLWYRGFKLAFLGKE